MGSRQHILVSFVIMVLFALFLIIIFSDHGVADLNLLKKEKESLIDKNAGLVQENLVLYRTIDRLKNDLGFIENVARQELGMIGKDEVIFKLKENREGDK